MTVGILVEKGSAYKKFEKALGNSPGTYNGESFVIAAASGHLYGLVKPEFQVADALVPKYKQWNLKNLPWDHRDLEWKLSATRGSGTKITAIKKAFASCDEIVIATDVDPTGEGDLLAIEILMETGLAHSGKKFSRMYFTDEAVSSLQKAFTTRKHIPSLADYPEYKKALYRSQFDFLTMQFTRIAQQLSGKVLRQGRLKSAMVQIVGDGEKAYKAYKPIPAYQNRFQDENGVMYTNPDEPKFKESSQVPQQYSVSDVVLDSKQNKSTAPPKLLDLAGLSAILSSQGIKADQVLSTYQTMYEAEVVSYPRTEDKTVTSEQFQELLPLVDKIAGVVGIDPSLLTHRSPRSTHVKDQGAHGANRPGLSVPDSLDELSSRFGSIAPKIYTLLARNYLTMLGEDYQYEHQKGHVKDYPAFVGSANVPKVMGFRAIFVVDADDKDDTENAVGLGTSASPYVHKLVPPRPPHPSMKWLMKQLEKRDVGTGATRTSTYAEITSGSDSILTEKRGKLFMAELGQMSYLLLPGTHIGDLSVTEHVYADMRGIVDGTVDPDKALAIVAEWVRDDIATMTKNTPELKKEFNVSGNADKEYFTGPWNGEQVKFNRVWSGHRFTDAECEKLCSGEVITFEAKSKKDDSTYPVSGKLANLEYKGHKYVGFEKDVQTSGSDVERIKGTWNGRQVSFKRQWSTHTFTDDEAQALLDGQQISFEAKAKSGNMYTAKGKLEEREYNGHNFVGFQLAPRD